MNGDELVVVADVLRETAEPLPDGERRTLLLGLAEVFREVRVRLNDGIATPVLIADPEDAVSMPPIQEP